jgi:hypothetical protein
MSRQVASFAPKNKFAEPDSLPDGRILTLFLWRSHRRLQVRQRLAARIDRSPDPRGETPLEPAGEDARATFLPGG